MERGRMDWSDVLSVTGGIENTVNIGSIASGGGAGKATFKELKIKKQLDSTSTSILNRLASGKHFDDLVIEFVQPNPNGAGILVLKWEFKLVLVQDSSIDVSEGDDTLIEEIVFQYGAQKVTTYRVNPNGTTSESGSAKWSRVLNEANFAVE